MRTFNWLIGSLILLCSACQPSSNGFTICGKLTGDAENGKVYLQEVSYTEVSPLILDSTTIVDGTFQLTGKVEEPEMYRIIIDVNKTGEAEDLRNKKFSCPFYLENSFITFEGDITTLPGFYWSERKTVAPVINGSATHDLYLDLQNRLKEINDTLRQLGKRYLEEYHLPALRGEDRTEAGIAIVKQEKIWELQNKKKTLDFIKNHSTSIVAYDAVIGFLGGITVDFTATQIDEMLEWLKPAWQHTTKFDTLVQMAEKAKRIAIGEKYLDEDFQDIEGNIIKLSSLLPENEYVMLEFWASWCGPCRAEIPHLVKIHQKYPDFKLISISIDEKETQWRKAVNEENMTWQQLRIPNGFEGEAAKAYNINGVPTCIILDKEGRFYKTNMRGAYLDEFLQEIYDDK